MNSRTNKQTHDTRLGNRGPLEAAVKSRCGKSKKRLLAYEILGICITIELRVTLFTISGLMIVLR